MPAVSFKPLTAARWKDFEALFGPNGACAGCWCMFYRLPAAEFAKARGAGAKRAFKKIAASGRPTGVLAYSGRRAVGWCAAAPREEFRRFESSRLAKSAPAEPAWSAPCLFIAKDFRGQGLAAQLLSAAGRYAAGRGARRLEGYPVVPKGKTSDSFLWWGTESSFKKAGFRTVGKPSASRRIMSKSLRP